MFLGNITVVCLKAIETQTIDSSITGRGNRPQVASIFRKDYLPHPLVGSLLLVGTQLSKIDKAIAVITAQAILCAYPDKSPSVLLYAIDTVALQPIDHGYTPNTQLLRLLSPTY